MKLSKRIMALGLSLMLVAGMVFSIPAITKAASFSVTSGLSADLSSQEFNISNPGGEELYYDVEKEGSMVQTGVPVSSSTVLRFPDINAYYVVYVYNMDGTEVSAVSPSQHPVTVSYNVGGQMVSAYTTQIYQGESFAYDADEYYMAGNKEYRIKAGESASQILYFGKSSYVFNYELYEPEAVTASVYYVDTSGNEIGKESKQVGYYDGSVSFSLPAVVSFEGREYEKVSATNTVSVNYFSPQLSYDIAYRMKGAPQEGPYSVEVVLLSEDGMSLGNRYYTVDSNVSTVELPEQPATLSARNGGVITYYEAVDDTRIVHDTAGDIRQYVIKYRTYDQKSPYLWSIRMVDAVSGKILSTVQTEIEAEGSAAYEAESIIKTEGKNYILDAGMQKQYTHQYGDNRILNIYYNEEGKDVAASYALNVRYKSVSTDEVLFEAKQEVTPETDAVIASPGEYEANSKNYVRLAGQEDQVTHNFYNPQRNYTVYYRDVNDLQNVDTVVTQEEIILTENLIVQDTAATDTADTAAAPVTVLTNQTTGEVVTLTDEGVPLAGGTPDNPQFVTAPDEEVPLAKGTEDKKGAVAAAAANPFASGAILAALIAVCGVGGYFFMKKKKKENKEE